MNRIYIALTALLLSVNILCARDTAAAPKFPANLTNTAPASGTADMPKLLLSGRLEMLHYLNAVKPIRQGEDSHGRFYFNNIYLNLESYIHPKIHVIVEFQALTSDLYMLGGFVTVSDSIAQTTGPASLAIRSLVSNQLQNIEEASEKPSFERIQIDFALSRGFSIRLGKVRNPFGFWDDYSLLRNLSFVKTDPVTLGVPLRRTDLGGIIYGRILGKHLTYEIGLLSGEYFFSNRNSNDKLDLILKLGSSFGRADIAAHLYIRDAEFSPNPSHALGFSFRLRPSRSLTLLGEFVYMKNTTLDLESWSAYLQANWNLSETVLTGLRLNIFIEYYESALLEIAYGSEDDSDHLQISAGLLYAINRHLDLGLQVITGIDQDGDAILKTAVKIDAKI